MTADSNNQKSNKIWVEDLSVGKTIKTLFQLTRINIREYDKGKFLTVRLGDKTGKVNGIMWDGAEEVSKIIREGDIIHVTGRVGTYNNEKQITINDIKVIDLSTIDPTDFLPASEIPVELLIQRFDLMIEDVGDPHYKALLQAFRNNEEYWSKFCVAPAAKRWHHAHLHGLIEHTIFVTKLCQLIAPMYPHVNQDLLVTGAVFHDSGKMEELTYATSFDYSTQGRLVGHTFIGLQIIEKLIDTIPDFPHLKKVKLQHVILSHHGEVERSPILPMTLEANLFHFIDNMDSKMAGMMREMKKAHDEGNEWTDYVKLMDRYLYLGDFAANEENSEESQ
jgi:3'-5' exoribonuclease